MSAVREDVLVHYDALSPEQSCVVGIAARNLENFRKAVLAEADRIEQTTARTDAKAEPAIDVNRFDTPRTERTNAMQTKHDTNETEEMNFDEAARLDTAPDDANDPIVVARAARDQQAHQQGRAPVVSRIDAEEDRLDARKVRRDALRLRLGDPTISKRELDEIVRMRGGDPDLEGMSAEGIRELLSIARAKLSAAEKLVTAENTDSDDSDDVIDRARRARDLDASTAWKAGRR